ncbi:hypothetical protein [Halalkalibacter alkalisediminis]|uniref:Uncharacterized protein n=1 Tax=Halalkalibacter alkalisediminis TaxID=935616 RepID=A0ABV6NHQ3_9BACI|nr:hypothetical protein [Halalkalibacter alkalisediminis]
MGIEYDARNNGEPKVFVEKQTDHVNQPFFYRNSRMVEINSRFGELQQTIREHGDVHKTLANKLNEQQGYTKKLDQIYEELKETVKEKSEIQEELVMKVTKYEEEKRVLQKQFEDLYQSKNKLADQVLQLETAKKDLYAEIKQHSTFLQEQEFHFQKVESEQLEQKERHDELIQQVGLQEIDHGDLLKKVKENEEEQKSIQLQVEELIERTATLVLQHRDQEKMHLDLYTELIQLKAVSGETNRHLHQSLAKVNSEIKQIQSQEKTTIDSI